MENCGIVVTREPSGELIKLAVFSRLFNRLLVLKIDRSTSMPCQPRSKLTQFINADNLFVVLAFLDRFLVIDIVSRRHNNAMEPGW